jgi:hypothetical protein
MIDSFAQLRMVLHLFNAFKRRGIFHEGRFPLLDTLDRQFESSEAIWAGPKPRQGEFVKQWWIAYGLAPDAAERCSEETRRSIESRQVRSRMFEELMKSRTEDSKRELVPIRPGSLSQSYRRICLGDFTGMEDKYHNARQRREGKGTTLYEHAVRCNDTVDAMDDEQKLLSLNLSSTGGTSIDSI